MKLKYIKPRISVEALEKSDVLTASPTDPTETTPAQKSEKENRYGDFISFAFDPKNWFD